MDQHLLHRGVADLFTTARSRSCRVGVELEMVSRDAEDGSVVRIERVRRAVSGATYAAWLGFEPGGQVELSLPCCRTVVDLDRAARAAVGQLRADCAAVGVQLDSAPMDDRGPAVPLQLTSRRYTEMEQHFDRIGPAGRTMMRLTASTQVCLDWWPGRAGLEQWRLLQLVGPCIAALFPGGSWPGSGGSGPGSRLATWLAVDPGRTAFDGRLLAGDPVAAYTAFAAGAVPFALPEHPEDPGTRGQGEAPPLHAVPAGATPRQLPGGPLPRRTADGPGCRARRAPRDPDVRRREPLHSVAAAAERALAPLGPLASRCHRAG